MPFSRRTLAWIAGCALLSAAILGALAAAAPRLLDLDRTRRYLSAQLRERLGGELTYESIELTLWPIPTATVRRGRVASAPLLDASWQELKLSPRLLPLLLGRVRIGAVAVVSPEIHLRLPEPPPANASSSTAAFPAAALGAITDPIQLQLTDGTLHFELQTGRTLTCRRINGRVTTDAGGWLAEWSSFGEAWTELRGRVSWDAVAEHGSATLEADNLQADRLLALVPGHGPADLGDSLVSGTLEGRWSDEEHWQVQLKGLLHQLTLRDGLGSVTLRGRDFAATIRHAPETLAIELERLALSEPAVTFTGKYLAGPESPRRQLDLTALDLDLDSVRPVAAWLLTRHRVARQIFDVLRGGTIATVTFISRADSDSGLGDHHRFEISGRVAGATVHVPDLDLDLEDVRGTVLVQNGILTGSDLSGRMGESRADSARLVLDLAEKTGPFALAMQLDADLRPLPPLLARLVKQPAFVEEMAGLEIHRGRARGRLQLGERRDQVEVKVEARDIQAELSYRRSPRPIQVNGGSFDYERNQVRIREMNATIGATALSAVAADLDWNGPVRIQSRLAARTDLAELFAWLNAAPEVKGKLEHLQGFQGEAELSTLEWHGPVTQPEQWRFQLAGEVHRFAMAASFLPGPISAASARFSADPEDLNFAADSAQLLDSDAKVSGRVRGYLHGMSALELQIDGRIQPQTAAWCSGLVAASDRFIPRAPFQLSRTNLTWEPPRKVTIAAALAFPDGPEAELALTAFDRSIKINRLLLNDGPSRLRLDLDHSPETLEVRFAGQVQGSTLDRVLVANDFLSGSLEGDFTLHLPYQDWKGLRTEGSLVGHGINRPWSLAWHRRWPFTLESIVVKGQQDRLRIDSAILDWDGAPIAVTGDLHFFEKLFTYDLNIKAGELTWSQLRELVRTDPPDAPTNAPADARATPKQATEAADGRTGPVIRGAIELRADRFHYPPLVLEPFAAAITVRGKALDFRILEARTCGLDVSGDGSLDPRDYALSLGAAARRELLNATVACFWNKPEMIDGHYDLAARLQASGDPERFWQGLAGDFQFKAENGRIYRFTLLSKIFAVLNLTEMLRGRVPDLLHEGFAYNSLILNGPIREGRLVMEQGYLDGASMGIAWEGSCDLSAKTLDLVLLVAPFKTVDSILKTIPLVNTWLQGKLISIPVRVTGPIEDPEVVPLPPSEVGKGIWGFVERTLRLPLTVIQPLLP